MPIDPPTPSAASLATERYFSLIATKPGSWIALISQVEQWRDDKGWYSWKGFILPLLRTCVDAGLDEYFRVGQSMDHIIFSTTEKHRLGQYSPSPLRITIRSKDRHKRWYVARSYGNIHFSEPDREDEIELETAFSALKSCLADLWRETRPGEALPKPLTLH